MYLFPSHPNGYPREQARARAGLVWFVTALLTGAVALAPVYLHLNGATNLFTVHAAAPDAVHAGMNHAAAHSTLTHDDTATEPDAPAPKRGHKGHAFCFFCVVLMTLQPSVVGVARLGLPSVAEGRYGGLEPHLKLFFDTDAQPRAPPLS